jgi:hypothetical protein
VYQTNMEYGFYSVLRNREPPGQLTQSERCIT